MHNEIEIQTVHVGPLPPPIGGISIYLYRLSRLNKDKNTRFVNEIKLSRFEFIKLLFRSRKTVFIYHSPSLLRRLMFYFMSLLTNNEYIIVSHGQGLENDYKKASWIIKYLTRKMILNSNYIQVVGRHLVSFLQSISYPENNILIKHAFIEPPLEDEDGILKTYPDDLNKFLNFHEKIIVANAASISFDKDGIDLYGLDMCIELTSKLKKEYPNIRFVFALANEKANIEYLNKMKQKIKELEIEQNFYFLTGQKELWPLFKKASLMIRPTSSDGYGISIAEALHFNCPAIASDVSDRPEGTIMFKSRDINDLYEKSIKVLDEERL